MYRSVVFDLENLSLVVRFRKKFLIWTIISEQRAAVNAKQTNVSIIADIYSNIVTSLSALKLSIKVRRFGTIVIVK